MCCLAKRKAAVDKGFHKVMKVLAAAPWEGGSRYGQASVRGKGHGEGWRKGDGEGGGAGHWQDWREGGGGCREFEGGRNSGSCT